MRQFIYSLFTFTIILSSSFLNAQETKNPWSIGFGINAINNPVTEIQTEAGRYKTWNMNAAGFKLTGSRYIKSGFIFETAISLNTITENKLEAPEEFAYISFDGMVKYNLTSSLSQVDAFNPYLAIGGGYTWLDQIGAGTANVGIGVNIWISDNMGFNAQSTYKHAFKDYGLKHFQHSAGLVFKFGGKDSDNDGLFDNEDKCPKQFGLIQFNGCPDTDKDGVQDSKDACPQTAGLIELNGCPDKDEDGVADKDDLCPDEKGFKNTLGCPDKDGDVTPDKYDKCPEVPGSMKNNGCPWEDTDKDGVLDKDDKCPYKIGPPSNKGCPFPKLNKTSKQEIDNFAKTILFDLGKALLTDSDKLILDDIAKIMSTFKEEKFVIEGHTDNTFTKEFNLKLSLDRANAVVAYLITKDIDINRLTAFGYGEERPLFSNNSEEDRSKNRRVEIILKR